MLLRGEVTPLRGKRSAVPTFLECVACAKKENILYFYLSSDPMPIFSFMYYIELYSVDINGKQHNPNKYFGVIHLFWSVPTFLEMSFVHGCQVASEAYPRHVQ